MSFSGCSRQAQGSSGPRSCGSWALDCELSSWNVQAIVAHSMWNLLGQGSNPFHQHWQTDSYPLYHQGSPFKDHLCSYFCTTFLGLLDYNFLGRKLGLLFLGP